MKNIYTRLQKLEKVSAGRRWFIGIPLNEAYAKLSASDRKVMESTDLRAVRANHPEIWQRFDGALALAYREADAPFSLTANQLLLVL